MKFDELNKKLNELGYFAAADRVRTYEGYAQLNRVHIFKENGDLEAVKINEAQAIEPIYYEKVPDEVKALVKEFDQTSPAERDMDHAKSLYR